MMALAYAKMYAQAQTHFETRKAQGVLRVPRIACTREFIAAAGALDCACEAVDATIPADERSVATVYEVYASALDGGDAKGLAEKILAENPSAELEYLLGDALRVGGKIMDACAWFVRAYKKDPRDLSMLIGAGKSLLDAGDTAHARLLAEAAMKAAPFDERVRAFYVKCR